MFVLAIFILSCSAGLSTEYRLPGTLTSKLQDQQRLWSDRWKYLMELVKRSHQTNRGVCPCWGDSVVGGNFGYLYANISGLGTKLFHPFLSSSSSANHSS